MKPIRTLEVAPYLPPELECIRELAYNLMWTWDHDTISLFRRLDKELWETTGHNPVVMLGSIAQERLAEAARDEGFLGELNRICERYHEYISAESNWYSRVYKKRSKRTVAYFSAEFGLTEALPIYSGGLGILAGDHVKAASELGVPLVGMGIVYQQGYFRQYLNADGWQQERYPINDFYNLPILPVKEQDGSAVIVSIDMPGRKVFLRIWKAQVGRVPLYLLDANIPENSKSDEDITDALYHADPDIRIKQEMILGIGGMRALKAVGIEPSVCHMNEGHSAFLALERIRILMQEEKLDFAQAREVAAAGHIFTTHTAVPAGIDKFSPELMEKYFSEYYRSLGLTKKQFLALGRSNAEDDLEPFSMALLAINLSSKVNAVSKLHGEVSRLLFQSAWPDLPVSEVPIGHITNGIHARSWISDEMGNLYDRYLGPKWSEDVGEQNIWRKVEEISDEELWRIHERRRLRLVNFARRRVRKQMEQKGALPSELKQASAILDPEILTIGFARRVATYKRATLLLSDMERLAQILTNKDRPVQIIIAGKGHPEDTPAKELIRKLIHFSRLDAVKRRFVFLEDYDMNVSRWMVQGVDVWLNTPRRPLEACGTSGMKVIFNGGINLSVLDGWWDEAYKPNVGWAIGHGEHYADNDYQDEVESNALYDLLEKEIVPLFYDRDKDGMPRSWVSRIKESMVELCPQFTVNRMVRDYTAEYYEPLTARYERFLSDHAEKGKQLAEWKALVRSGWPDVRIDQVESNVEYKFQVGNQFTVRAHLSLGKLQPKDLLVQIYHGPIDAYGNIRDGQSMKMELGEESKGQHPVFIGKITFHQSGRHGFSVRVLPHHDDLGSPFEVGLIHWASEPISVLA